MKHLYYILFLLFSFTANAQDDDSEEFGGFAWGIKSGLSVGTQKWNNSDRDPLFRYHAALFMESIKSQTSAIYGQIGYHIRGSSVFYPSFSDPATGRVFRGFSEGFQFKNLSLSAGMKQKKGKVGDRNYFYGFGLRAETTLKTNLPKGEEIFSLYFPYDGDNNVKRIIGGMDISGGFEMKFSELVGGTIQVTISPDFTRQYFQFPIPNVRDPYSGQKTTIPGQDIRNLSLELSIGLKFLRKVVYVD